MAQKGFVPNCHHNWLRGQIIWLTWGYPHNGGDSNGTHLSAGIKDEKCQTLDMEVVDFC